MCYQKGKKILPQINQELRKRLIQKNASPDHNAPKKTKFKIEKYSYFH